jgi:hypothetical protein
MNKATTTVASVPLTWAEDDALQSLAKALKMPKAGVLRVGLLALLKEHCPAEASRMLRGRMARTAMFFFILTVPCVSADMRRPRRSGMMARTVAHASRKVEVAA